MATDPDNLDLDEDDLFGIYGSMYDIDFLEKDVAESLYVYASPVFLVVGTMGNLLSCIVLFKMSEKVLTTCLYLAVICIIDLLVLYIRCGNMWLAHLADINVEVTAKHSSNSVCKIYPFVSNFALHLSIWLLVAMATETTIVTLKPDRLIRVCVLERAKAVILLIIVLLVCVNAHCFWTYALVKEKPDNAAREICSNVRQGQINEEFRRVVWPIIDILVTHLFPYFTIFSCTVIMITKKVKRHNQSRETHTIWKQYPLDGPSAKDFQYTILVLCLIYLILMITKFATDIFLFLARPDSLKLVEFSLILDAKMILAESISETLHYVLLCSKFFIFIGSSKRFRDELRLLLTCWSCRRRRRPHPSSNRCISNRTPQHATPNMGNKTPILENHQPHHTHIPVHPHYHDNLSLTASSGCNSVDKLEKMDRFEKRSFAITSV